MTWSATLQLVVWSLGVAACVSPTSPIATCTSGQTTRLTLTVGAYTSIDPSSDAGCVTIAANASMTDSAEYLVIAQSAGGTPGDSAAFQLGSSALTAAVVAQVVPPETQSSVAAQFDHFLREAARTGRYPATPNSLVALPEPNVSASTGPAVAPPVGDARTFKVCANLTCSSLVNVGAIARAVVGHIAIYVDTLAPKNGLDSAEVDTLAQLFEHHVYEVDTTAFGNELDTENNSVVIALMSPTVNQLAPSPCTNGFVSGFCFSADLDPRFAASYNHGEVIYTIVADPSSTVSCAHTVAYVKQMLPGTFLHEVQHLINYTQHVLVQHGRAEDDWLDEGLSKYAEELGGRSFLPGTPTDTATFNSYVYEDLHDAFLYLRATGSHFMLTTTDQSLPDVGAGWLFVRYVADQFGAAITRTLVQTSLTGTTNVATQTGQAFEATASRWALANWVSDLQVTGLVAPPELTYTSWQLRSAYAALNARDPTDFPRPFPLAPIVSAGSQVSLSGFLRAGSGAYVRALQAPGAAQFSLLFAASGTLALPAHIVPRLDIVRIR